MFEGLIFTVARGEYRFEKEKKNMGWDIGVVMSIIGHP